jgi:hypothetical protein
VGAGGERGGTGGGLAWELFGVGAEEGVGLFFFIGGGVARGGFVGYRFEGGGRLVELGLL